MSSFVLGNEKYAILFLFRPMSQRTTMLSWVCQGGNNKNKLSEFHTSHLNSLPTEHHSASNCNMATKAHIQGKPLLPPHRLWTLFCWEDHWTHWLDINPVSATWSLKIMLLLNLNAMPVYHMPQYVTPTHLFISTQGDRQYEIKMLWNEVTGTQLKPLTLWCELQGSVANQLTLTISQEQYWHFVNPDFLKRQNHLHIQCNIIILIYSKSIHYLGLFEFLVIICLQLHQWTKDVLVLISILIPEGDSYKVTKLSSMWKKFKPIGVLWFFP